MLHYLIQNGVNVHQPTCTLQRRPVHYAALRQQVSCLQMLVCFTSCVSILIMFELYADIRWFEANCRDKYSGSR
ncbi:unnamed protein product [Schistosoma curassoni]|uniref:ANK_REP_REGION domain-containing protein n=1 Tax=Schistosoma curassoni TaxID=6186 RepID=A0A183L760_9TREM|nr:unnamed protein product [Schistosoma curassoni]